MASDLGYATEVDLENLLLVDIDASFSSQIDTWISSSEVSVNNFLGYTTASGIWNESVVDEKSESRVDGDLNLVLHPRKRPINSVSAISIIRGSESTSLDLTDADGNSRYIIPASDRVIIYPSSEMSSTGTITLTSFSNIKFSRYFTKISYIGGYTSVPEPIKLATTLYLADTFMRQANKEGLASVTQGRLTKRWSETKDGESGFIKSAKQLLMPYRISSNWF